MSTYPIDTAHTFPQHPEERKNDKAAFNGYDYRVFRISLVDVISSWAFSAVVIVLTFVIFG